MPTIQKTKRIYDFIQHYQQSNGETPTLREIGKAFAMSSSASVHSHVRRMEDNGWIARVPHISRGIRLETDKQHMQDQLTKAASSIRAELKDKFPRTRFVVRSKRYSGGNSINIFWTGGPERGIVSVITRKYEEGYFDGMTDSYVRDEDPRHLEFHRLRGSAKYVMLQRRAA
jgi:conjugative element/phage-associated large polyvalent protein/LexA DNA binding domain-containing protein